MLVALTHALAPAVADTPEAAVAPNPLNVLVAPEPEDMAADPDATLAYIMSQIAADLAMPNNANN